MVVTQICQKYLEQAIDGFRGRLLYTLKKLPYQRAVITVPTCSKQNAITRPVAVTDNKKEPIARSGSTHVIGHNYTDQLVSISLSLRGLNFYTRLLSFLVVVCALCFIILQLSS